MRGRARPLFVATALGATLAAGCGDSLAPIDAPPVFVSVTTGGDHSCAVAEEGEIWCWGAGRDGQLGAGTLASSPSPTRVAGSTSFTEVTAGSAHTCALADDGAAWCWGWNAYYQRGNPSDTAAARPVPVLGGQTFVAIDAGWYHTCGLTAAGDAYCWGYNRFGQLGNGTTETAITPVAVQAAGAFTSISAGGMHTCAVDAEGVAWCWGLNEQGQLGSGEDVVLAATPRRVSRTQLIESVSAGATHSCAISGQRAYCWGSNSYGELGDGSSFRPGLPGQTVPTEVVINSTFRQIDAGHQRTCGVAPTTGRAYCWGRGELGQLGNGNMQHHSLPQLLTLQPGNQHRSDLLTFRTISAQGESHTCGLIGDDYPFCWGSGEAGELGNENNAFSTMPVRVTLRP